MIPPKHRAGGSISRFPRVSGDDPVEGTWQTPHLTFSPRERG